MNYWCNLRKYPDWGGRMLTTWNLNDIMDSSGSGKEDAGVNAHYWWGETPWTKGKVLIEK